MQPRLVSTVLHVGSVHRALEFYEVVFGFHRRFVDDLGVYAEAETGPTSLGFAEREFARQQAGPTAEVTADLPAPPAEIAVGVDDVPGAVDRALDAGAQLVRAPEIKYWGQTVGYVRDLDGHLIQICTPLAAHNLPGNP